MTAGPCPSIGDPRTGGNGSHHGQPTHKKIQERDQAIADLQRRVNRFRSDLMCHSQRREVKAKLEAQVIADPRYTCDAKR